MTRRYHDAHLHSELSLDARDPVAKICAEAASKGLDGITFTDHVDIEHGRAYLTDLVARITQEIPKAAERHRKDLTVLVGMELGEPHHDPALARELSSAPGIDFVLGSLHMMRGEPDFCRIDYAERDIDDLIERYYAELYEIADTADFDSLAHVDYIVRYMPQELHDTVSFSRHRDALEPVLRRLAERGKALEINTSIGKRYGDIVPSLEVFRMFRRAGGELVTIGTDAHRAEHIGGRLDDAMDLLAAAGFDRYAIYEKRRPVMYPTEQTR